MLVVQPPNTYNKLKKKTISCWDSLGEFMALGASFEHLANATNNPKPRSSAPHRHRHRTHLMETEPQPKGRELDNRGTTYVAAFWAQALPSKPTTPSWRHRAARGNHEHRTGQRDPSPERRSGQRGGWVGTSDQMPRRQTPSCVRWPCSTFARSRWRLNSGVDGLTADRMQHEAFVSCGRHFVKVPPSKITGVCRFFHRAKSGRLNSSQSVETITASAPANVLYMSSESSHSP